MYIRKGVFLLHYSTYLERESYKGYGLRRERGGGERARP